MNLYTLLGLLVFCKLVICVRNYYVGTFNKNDLLVAQDTLFKDKGFHRTVSTDYVRYFKCPISYYHVLDRLGVGRGPRVEIIRGGLLRNVLGLRITSMFNMPINVNIYVGCANLVFGKNVPLYTRAPWTRAAVSATGAAGSGTGAASSAGSGPGTNNKPGGNSRGSTSTQAGDKNGQDTTKAGDKNGQDTTKAGDNNGQDTTKAGDAKGDETTTAAGKDSEETTIQTTQQLHVNG